jgi:phage tail sheath protein FI
MAVDFSGFIARGRRSQNMPEYLAPGVFVEETSFRSKSIEGVSTSTAGFVGPALFGPTSGVPELLTSFSDFERIFGGLDQITFASEQATNNFLAHAVRAFFSNGGRRLYIARAFSRGTGDGVARATLTSTASVPETIDLQARYPGSAGNITVTFTARVSQNVLSGVPRDPSNPLGARDPVLRGADNYDVVWIGRPGSIPRVPPTSGTLYWAERYFDNTNKRQSWRFYAEGATSGNPTLLLTDLDPDSDYVRIVTVSVVITFPGQVMRTELFPNLALHPDHPNSLSQMFNATLNNRALALTVPLIFDPSSTLKSGPQVGRILFTQPRSAMDRSRVLRLLNLPAGDTTTDLSILATLGREELSEINRQVTAALSGGNDGARPGPDKYEGEDSDPKQKTALKAFEDVADISIVAAPGYSFNSIKTPAAAANAQQTMGHLISHCERMRYRIAVLDSGDQQDIATVRSYRAQVDSKHAALYYPWVTVMDPITDEEIILPPSGFVAGLYADNDIKYGVHKAPANQVVQLAIGFEITLNKAQQEVLNPEGINCCRFFEGRGYRLWGARTISSDPEWKYVNLRRYFAYLERSIDVGTQWVVFENNSEGLWSNVRRTVEDFLFNEWKSARLMGSAPEEAYFVRCDRSTMTQNDLDNGRLICLIGVAPVRPAEFVIFRIGQWVGTRA